MRLRGRVDSHQGDVEHREGPLVGGPVAGVTGSLHAPALQSRPEDRTGSGERRPKLGRAFSKRRPKLVLGVESVSTKTRPRPLCSVYQNSRCALPRGVYPNSVAPLHPSFSETTLRRSLLLAVRTSARANSRMQLEGGLALSDAPKRRHLHNGSGAPRQPFTGSPSAPRPHPSDETFGRARGS